MPVDKKIIENVKRNKMRYRAITDEVVKFPYGGEASITYDMWKNAMLASEEMVEQDTSMHVLDGMTLGGFSRLVSIFGDGQPNEFFGNRTHRDFYRVIDALKNGMKSELGETLELDRFGQPNIAMYTAGCRSSVSVPVDKVADIDLETFVAPWHGTGPVSDLPIFGNLPIFSEKDEELAYEVEGHKWAIQPYGLLWSWDQYQVLANLCAAGFDDPIRVALGVRKPHARRGAYKRKNGSNARTSTVDMYFGPITNALMSRNQGEILPALYFSEKVEEVDTGDGGYALVDVRASATLDANAAYREYRLSDRDHFWLDPLYTIADKEGKTKIQGSEILQRLGYSNPYAESSRETMADAARSINKAVSTRIGIDVTNEKRDKRKGHAKLTSSVRLQPIVNGIVDFDQYESDDGQVIRDFTINLQTEDPMDSLPIARYEKERGMLTMVEASDLRFASIKKLTTNDRQMWAYCLRIIRSKKLSDSILYETMWKNLELEEPEVTPFLYVDRNRNPLDAPLKEGGKPIDPEDAERASDDEIDSRRKEAVRRQRDRMIKKLEKMLDEKSGVLFKSWEHHKDKDGRVDGVKVTRLSGSKKN